MSQPVRLVHRIPMEAKGGPVALDREASPLPTAPQRAPAPFWLLLGLLTLRSVVLFRGVPTSCSCGKVMARWWRGGGEVHAPGLPSWMEVDSTFIPIKKEFVKI